MPNNVLTNVEFLCLKMFTHPGQSGRFYRRALSQYKDPARFARSAKLQRGDNNAMYFTRACYCVKRYWVDHATRDRHDPMPFLSTRGGAYEARKPGQSEWQLTDEGIRIAMRARAKIACSKEE